jgi:hypothetical protein
MCSCNFDEILVECEAVHCIKITKCNDSELYRSENVCELEIQCAKHNEYKSYPFSLDEVEDLKEALDNCLRNHGEHIKIADQYAKIYCYALLQKIPDGYCMCCVQRFFLDVRPECKTEPIGPKS